MSCESVMSTLRPHTVTRPQRETSVCYEVLSCAERPTLHPSERGEDYTESHRKPDYEGHDCLTSWLGTGSVRIENRRSHGGGRSPACSAYF